jgi:hypothetical protein
VEHVHRADRDHALQCLVGLRQVGKAESAMNALQPMIKVAARDSILAKGMRITCGLAGLFIAVANLALIATGRTTWAASRPASR